MPAHPPPAMRPLLLLLALLLAPAAAAQRPAFPLRISDNQRYFVDQSGTPFLYHADTPWQIYVKLTTAEAREYLAFRRAQGYTTVQTQIAMDPAARNRDGRPAFGGDNDFARPDEAYHQHISDVIDIADSLGMLVVLSQPWLGCCEEAYGGRPDKPIRANGARKNRDYGRYLGRRFAQHRNLFWIIGGDNDPKADRAEVVAFAEGLRETAPAHQLLTYHASTTHSSTDLFQYAPWLGFSMIYTYWRDKPSEWVDPQAMPEVYEAALREYNKSDRMPFVLGESQYEGFTGNDIGTPQQVRRQAWWTMLCGGAGHAYGSENWRIPASWREILRWPGAAQMQHVAAFFQQIPWWRLVPDQRHRAVVAGYGTWTKPNYVAAALTDDARLLVAYLPERRTIVADLARMAALPVAARWYDPRTGAYTDAGTFAAARLEAFTPPSNEDWVLLLAAK